MECRVQIQQNALSPWPHKIIVQQKMEEEVGAKWNIMRWQCAFLQWHGLKWWQSWQHDKPSIYIYIYIWWIVLPEDVHLGGWRRLCSSLNIFSWSTKARILSWKLHTSLKYSDTSIYFILLWFIIYWYLILQFIVKILWDFNV